MKRLQQEPGACLTALVTRTQQCESRMCAVSVLSFRGELGSGFREHSR